MSDLLPSGWWEVALGELVHERIDRVGRADKPIVLSSTKYRGLVPSDEYFRGRTIYSADLSTYKRVYRGWFAYATNHLAEGFIGLQQDFDVACVSPMYTVFECGESVLPPFLYRILKSPSLIAKYGLHEQASVDRRGAVRFRDFARIPIKIPCSLTEQRVIAEILDTLDDRIMAEEDLLAKVRAMHRGALRDLMTNGVKGSSPSWNSFPCKAAFSLASGAPYDQAQPDDDGSFPIYGSSGLAGFGRKSLTSEPTFVIGRVGEGGVGSVYYLPGPSWVTDNALWAKRIDSGWLPEFIAKYLSWLDLRRRRSQTGQPLVTQAVIGECPLMKPDLDEQRDVVQILNEWSSRECSVEICLGKLGVLKQGLMEDLLTGRVRVTGGGAERLGADQSWR